MTTDNQNQNNVKAVLANALVWAAVLIATSIVMGDAADQQKSSLLLIHIIGWWASDNAIRQGRMTLKQEWACIKGIFKRKA
jgi:hypothetical protein